MEDAAARKARLKAMRQEAAATEAVQDDQVPTPTSFCCGRRPHFLSAHEHFFNYNPFALGINHGQDGRTAQQSRTQLPHHQLVLKHLVLICPLFKTSNAPPSFHLNGSPWTKC